MLFYATFITGLQAPVSRFLSEKGILIKKMMDGAVLYEAEVFTALPCFTNVFAALSWQQADKREPLTPLLRKVSQHLEQSIPSKWLRFQAAQTFRLVTSVENQLVSVDKNLKKQVEDKIVRLTGMQAERGGADAEFWFLYRSEGFSFFLKRLTQHQAYDKSLRRGELRPELAFMLNYLSEPEDKDVFLDPFCGYGAIPLARARYFPFLTLYASDIDTEKIQAFKKDELSKAIRCSCMDFESLPEILGQGLINKIVTDPPWGLFENIGDLHKFYSQMLKIFLHIVSKEGIIVLLTSQKELLRELLLSSEVGDLVLRETYDILVSGKKAGVFVIDRL